MTTWPGLSYRIRSPGSGNEMRRSSWTMVSVFPSPSQPNDGNGVGACDQRAIMPTNPEQSVTTGCAELIVRNGCSTGHGRTCAYTKYGDSHGWQHQSAFCTTRSRTDLSW